jgi:hypothetical protein
LVAGLFASAADSLSWSMSSSRLTMTQSQGTIQGKSRHTQQVQRRVRARR